MLSRVISRCDVGNLDLPLINEIGRGSACVSASAMHACMHVACECRFRASATAASSTSFVLSNLQRCGGISPDARCQMPDASRPCATVGDYKLDARYSAVALWIREAEGTFLESDLDTFRKDGAGRRNPSSRHSHHFGIQQRPLPQ